MKFFILKKIKRKMSNSKKSPRKRKHFSNWSKNIPTNLVEDDLSSEDEGGEDDHVELPGFYFDPVKKKYFKVQKNSYGVQSSITYDSLKTAKKQQNEEKSARKKSSSEQQNLLFSLLNCENGMSEKLRIDLNDFKITKSKQRNLLSFGQIYGENLREISLFHFNNDKTYLLTNFYQNQEYLARIFKIDSNLEIKLSQTQLNNPNSYSEEFKTSSTKAQIFNSNFLMRSFVSSKFSILYVYYLTESENCELNCLPKMKKDYASDLWCSSLNSNETCTNQLKKCAVGFSNHALVDLIERSSGTQKLDTKKTCVYSIKFKPSDHENLVYAGCRNKFLYGYDLRQSSARLKISSFEHQSCVGDLLFHNSCVNYIFSNDFSGKAYVWDIRMSRILNEYETNSELNTQCGFKLSKCGNYLYMVAKDGHLRVWNIKKNELIKTYLTPRPKSKHELYAAIPCFDLTDDLCMYYACDNVLSLYSL